MNGKKTLLDAAIQEKLPAFIEAADRASEARREANARDSRQNELEKELQDLLIARSVLRNGKAYDHAEANMERARLVREARS